MTLIIRNNFWLIGVGCSGKIHRFVVNAQVVAIFNGVSKPWKSAQNAEKFVEMRAKNECASQVNHDDINHDRSLRRLHLAFIRQPHLLPVQEGDIAMHLEATMEKVGIRNANAVVLARMTGVPNSPATQESNNDPLNPNAPGLRIPCGAERSALGSSAESGRAPRPSGPFLRLVWSAQLHS